MRVFSWFTGALLSAVAFGRVSYVGQQIVTCELNDDSAFQSLIDQIDVQGVQGRKVDLRVKNQNEHDYIKKYTTACDVVVPDLEAATQKFEALNNEARDDPDWFKSYHTYDEIQNWYSDLARQYPQLLSWNQSVGKSIEGRDISALHIYDRSSRPTQRIFWTGQIHAREWISGATLGYIVDQIVYDWNRRDPWATDLLKSVEIIVLPIVNPDGYAWTWAPGGDRQWRKNRRPNIGINACFGVDQNRNYDIMWGQGGSSTNPCSDTYMGEAPASEPEVITVQEYFSRWQYDGGVAPNNPITGAIDWHSYSQLVLRPYGYTRNPSPDEAVLGPLGNNYSADIFNVDGKVYTSQPSIDLYVTTGTASDWYYSAAARGNSPNAVASYTVELRPASASGGGFLLPPVEIIPCGQENYWAIRNWLSYLRANPL